tara:strand:+ start:259 stop:708 length:450 start_codon:yes stop_codon:yes gene_type:complete
MISLKFNIEDNSWNKTLPMFKKYISRSVAETIKVASSELEKDSEISFLLTSDENIKELNFKYKNKNSSTNVLSFPMMKKIEGRIFIGDIAISSKKILEEANKFKKDKYSYLSKITIHGVLHLLGYDHQTDKEYKKMNKLEENIMKRLIN